jgi:hypothetical protein
MFERGERLTIGGGRSRARKYFMHKDGGSMLETARATRLK